jgi:nuclease HARBI1
MAGNRFQQLAWLEHLDAIEEVEEDVMHGRYRQRRDPFIEYNNRQFLKRYRFTKQAVRNLEERLRPRLTHRSNRNRQISPMLQLTTTLRFFATNNIQQVDGDLVGISQQTVSRIVRRVTNAICSLRQEFINFPNRNELNAVKEHFFHLSGFPQVIGAIDGTHVPIVSPGGDNAELYRNRKGYFSLNVQAIVDSTGKFTDIVVRWPGSTHDATIFNNSLICQRLEQNEFDGLLLGDSGYPCKRYLLTPFLHPVNEAQHRYNHSHIGTRSVVERTFGRWKNRFRCLLTPLRLALATSQNVIIATACLHNLAISLNIPIPDDDLELPHFPQDINDEINVAGQARRDHIVANYFT